MVEIFGDYQTMAYFFGILIGTFLVGFLFRKLFGAFIRRSAILMRNDPTNYQFLRHAITALIYLLGVGWALHMVPAFRAVSSSLLTGAGILAVAAGFASQHALSNIMSGIFIVIFKPFRVNDRLRIGTDINGVVEDISLRHTVIRDFENRRVIIPNTVISNEVIVNSDFGDDKICRFIVIGISYESDVDLAREILREEIEKHPLLIDNRTEEDLEAGLPKVMIRVIELGAYSVNLRAWAWVTNQADGFVLSCDVLESVLKRYREAGIEIPYPHHTIVQKGS